MVARTAPNRILSTWRARLAALLVAPLLVVGLGLSQVAPVRADQLDDALARQKELAAQLAAQQAALNALISQQKDLAAQLKATTAALGPCNPSRFTRPSHARFRSRDSL